MTSLLGRSDPHPVRVYGVDYSSPFLFVSDHAGLAIPETLMELGITAEERQRHIGWDIGIDGAGRRLADKLGALLIEQVYSRLVIDSNRAPGHPTSIPVVSDGTVIPGNRDLDAAARTLREVEILSPYHDAIARTLDERQQAGRETFLIALHSFTPIMGGRARPWKAGVLHNRDSRFGRIVWNLLTEAGIETGDNEPYALTETSDYTIPQHGEAREIPHLELEIRQDLIADEAGQEEWSELLARLLPKARELYAQAYGKDVA